MYSPSRRPVVAATVLPASTIETCVSNQFALRSESVVSLARQSEFFLQNPVGLRRIELISVATVVFFMPGNRSIYS